MFKIKVGLKSFQPHYLRKCQYRIAQIVDYLEEFPVSPQSKDTFTSSLVRRRTKTETRATPPSLLRERTLCELKGVDLDLPRVKEKNSMQTMVQTMASGFTFHEQNGRTVRTLSKVNVIAEQNVSTVKSTLAAGGFHPKSLLAKQVSLFRNRLIAPLRDKNFHKEKVFCTKISKPKSLSKSQPQNLFPTAYLHGKRRAVPNAHRLVSRAGALPLIEISGQRKKTPSSASRQSTMREGNVYNKKSDKVKTPKKPTRDFFGITPLPKLVKKFTTLRSPHIDKKSREQFEWKREKAQIYFHLNSVAQISLALFILTHSHFPGVEVEIGVESKTYFA